MSHVEMVSSNLKQIDYRQFAQSPGQMQDVLLAESFVQQGICELKCYCLEACVGAFPSLSLLQDSLCYSAYPLDTKREIDCIIQIGASAHG
ncbi:uncharacterized protein PHALS_05253 [Plasmopara halstedii]|uniref:Uncharacterized protein n=1 Tax=Plasmopara halstedii TaxID=4781 RepID=A0A0P1AZW9_PLAHL|nr:uncharacterized protein PHALS_05253 [Plasmopara halstedii]CEG47930.1 hypothetical protein PHALS_05253 [Plasmopara halstedii]|eukprot:XP_024584299.1 hypothetical protein PHALS_05253 [Plasmopara halstedii]